VCCRSVEFNFILLFIHCFVSSEVCLNLLCSAINGSIFFAILSVGCIATSLNSFFSFQLTCCGYNAGQHIRCKPTNLCKLGNYQSRPLDVDPIDGVRGLKRKKASGWGA